MMCCRNSENSIWISCPMIFIIRAPEFTLFSFFLSFFPPKHMNEILQGRMPAFITMFNVRDCPTNSYSRCRSTLITIHVQLNAWRSDRNKRRRSWSLTNEILNNNRPKQWGTKTRHIAHFLWDSSLITVHC
jgi:hypothetical protein